MAKVYDEPRDAYDIPLHVNDHAVVVDTKGRGDEWLGHVVKIKSLQQSSDGTAWGAGIEMLYANPGSTWGLPPSCLRWIDKSSAEYAMAEASDRQSRAAVLQANAEKMSSEARNEMFVAQMCWARAAAVRAMDTPDIMKGHGYSRSMEAE